MSKRQQIILFIGLGTLIAFNLFRFAQKNWNMGDPIDLRGLYLGAELWAQNQDIYSDDAAAALWQEHKELESFSSTTDFGDPWVSIMVYPPHAFVLARPLIAFNWTSARLIWWTCCLAFLLGSAFLLYQISRNVLSIYLLLAFKGTFFALALGQPILLVFFCLLLALYLEPKNALLAGLFLGIAMIKFNVVIPFALWFMLKKRWSLLISAGLTTAFMLLPIFWHDPSIIQQYSDKLSLYYEMIYQNHPRNIYTSSDSELSMLLAQFIDQKIGFWKGFNLAAQFISYVLVAVLSMRQKWNANYTLLALLLSSFLFSYHLSYDAIILLIPILLLPSKKHSWIAILLFMLFSLPWNAVFNSNEVIKLNYPMFIMLGLILFTFVKDKSAGESKSIHTTS